MQRYFFDLRDDDGLIVDEEGLELKNLHIVQEGSCTLNIGHGSRCAPQTCLAFLSRRQSKYEAVPVP
jgi:hypothetical protein